MAKITTAALQNFRSLSLPLPLPPHPPPPSSPRHTRLCLRPRRSQATARRNYHSYEHDTPPPFTPAENAILTAAFPHISTHGFTTAALSRGARDVGYLDASINLFPSGAFALVNYHLVSQRLALADHHSTRQQAGGVAAHIEALAWKRLQANKPIIHRWQEVRLGSAPPFADHPSRHLCIMPTSRPTTPPFPFPVLIFVNPRSFSSYLLGSRPHRSPNEPSHLLTRTCPAR